jgi:hypothetical protein
MAIAQFKDLCLDAGDPARLGAFWAAVLDDHGRSGGRRVLCVHPVATGARCPLSW